MIDQNGGELMMQDGSMEMVNPQMNGMGSALANTDSNKAVAEIRASLVLAKSFPRNETVAERNIVAACKRETLAKSAVYLFRRGGTNVTGPTIRLAEVMARIWGNIQYGFKELDRGEDYSEIEAFAYDLQCNVKVLRQFRVKHWRDKKSGGEALTQERDKYEFIASQAQRRVRACILELIPGDIVELAVKSCDATVNSNIGDIDEAVANILAAFDGLGVTKEDVEGYLQRKVTSVAPADIVNLRKIYTSIKSGIAPKEEFFKAEDVENLKKRFARGKDNKPKSNTKTQGPKRGDTGGGKESRKSKVAGSKGGAGDTGGGSGSVDNNSAGEAEHDTKTHAEKVEQPERQPTAKEGTADKAADQELEGVMIPCPEAGGLMVDASQCRGKACYHGCPEWT